MAWYARVDTCLTTNTLHTPPHMDLHGGSVGWAVEQEELISVGF
jgi:hypothetical protein